MLGGLRQTSFTDELGLPQPAWTSLPTTKMKRPNRADAFAWCYSYTGFSLAFARAAIAQLGVQAGSSVVDPFVGSGTTLVAAALAGCSALGVDINPFSTLLSRARLATKADIGRVLDYLKTRTRKHIRECGEQVLHPRDQVYVDAVAAKIFDYHKLEPRRFWTALLENDVGRFDSEAVVILSLALGARDSARLVRGSNPIWYRKTSDGRDADASDLKAAAIRWGTSIVRDLVSASSIDRNGIKIINTDFNSDQLTGAFDFCLTSPPYLNRLDYVVAHLPELAVLQLITSVDIERLRSAMIGTTKIVAKDESPVPVDWGPTCLQTLKAKFGIIKLMLVAGIIITRIDSISPGFTARSKK